MSQANATDAPMPAAAPHTAEMMGTRQFLMARISGLKLLSRRAPASCPSGRPERLAPAQKARGLPASTMARAVALA